MQGPHLGAGGEDITWPDQVAPRGRKASSTRKIKPQTSNLLFDHVPYGDVDCSTRRVLVGVLVILKPVGAQPFAAPVRAGPDPPALVAEAVGVSFCLQPVFHCLQAVSTHILA